MGNICTGLDLMVVTKQRMLEVQQSVKIWLA